MQSLLTPRLPVPFAVAIPLLLPLLVCQLGMGLRLLLAVAVPLLLALRVYQLGTGLRLLLAVAVPLLLLLRVCQLGTGLYMLLAIAVSLLLSSCGGHAIHIVPLAVNGGQPILGGGVHSLVC